MPTPIVTQPIITTAGLIATRDAQGVAVRITHIGLGTASGYEPNKSQTALIAEKLRFPIAYTADVGMNFKQVTIDAIAEQGDPFFYGEIGFFMENGELFAVSSHLGDTAYLSDSISTTLTYSFGLSALPPDSVEFVIDSESAISYKLLEDHVKQYNPHPDAREATEINNAIAMGNNPLDVSQGKSTQLATAMSLINLNGATFIDAGGSTANVRNLKPINPNLILPTNPVNWLGANVYLQLVLDGSVATEITIKIYDNTNTLILTSAISNSQNRGSGGSDTYLNCIYGSNNKFYMVRCHVQYVKVTSGGFTWFYDNTKPVGERDFELYGIISSLSVSVTGYNYIALPFTATEILSIQSTGNEQPSLGVETNCFTQTWSDPRTETKNRIGYASYLNNSRSNAARFTYVVKGKY